MTKQVDGMVCTYDGPAKAQMFDGCHEEHWLDYWMEDYEVRIIAHTAKVFTVSVIQCGQGRDNVPWLRGAPTRDDAWNKAMRAIELLRALESL